MGGGLYAGKLYGLSGRKKAGKALAADTLVLTDAGWRPIAALKVGDRVASIDGAPSAITGVFPQGRKAAYRVTFSDGRSLRCCAEHLWLVQSWQTQRAGLTDWLVMDTTELGRRSRRSRPLWVPRIGGSYGEDIQLELDPYLLGAYLGDGSSRPGFTKPDIEVMHAIAKVIPAGMELVDRGRSQWDLVVKGNRARIGQKGKLPNPVKDALGRLGLLCQAHRKFIPEVYFWASRQSRLRLLQGLLDTDGGAGKG
ncbi:MAG: replicative DNA helicase, partial [Candidatus Dormibacteria bacterium]